NYEVQTPKKSILRSTSRATSNPASFEAEEEEYDNDVGETDLSTSVSLVNLRSTSPEIRRRRNSTNRLSDYPMNESANRNYSTYSGHRSPTTFSRTISPSSSSSLASYPANYEPSPLIRKKTFDDPGIELNNINNNELHQENNNNSIYEELQRLESNDESVHGNNINNNELHQENNHSIYEELQRLESNDESIHDVHDMFDIIENSEYYSTQGKGINRFGNSGYDQKGSTLTTTRITTPVKVNILCYNFYTTYKCFK
ncbi:unnamed protein product, partial [Trichobilharzia regenti]